MPASKVNDPRLFYTRIVKLLILVGLFLAAIPFFSSLSTNDATENDAWSSYYVGDMKPGELRKFPTAWIYKRTAEDKNMINRFNHLLIDPYSKTDLQPESARNVWRSEKEDFFVFFPWSTHRGLPVVFSKENHRNVFEEEILQRLPFLWSQYDFHAYDMSGRIYKNNGQENQNLRVPRVKWENKGQVRVYNRIKD